MTSDSTPLEVRIAMIPTRSAHVAGFLTSEGLSHDGRERGMLRGEASRRRFRGEARCR